MILVGALDSENIGQLYLWDLKKNTLESQMVFTSISSLPTLSHIEKGSNGKIILSVGDTFKLISYPHLAPEKKCKQIACENEPHDNSQSSQIKYRLI